MMKKSFFYIIIAVFTLFNGCATKPKGEILELKNQDIAFLYVPNFKDHLIWGNLTQEYNKILDMNETKTSPDEVFWGLKYKNSQNFKYFFSNRREIPNLWFEKNVLNADTAKFGSLNLVAITIKDTSMRNMPTFEPIFGDFRKGGEGYPFDYLQNSIINAQTPLFVSHFSKNRAFVFAKSPSAWGWIDARDIKFLNKKEITKFKQSKKITILRDKTAVYDKNGNFVSFLRMGTILNVNDLNSSHFIATSYFKNKNFIISKNQAVKFPAEFNDENINLAINSTLFEPYGWGGFGNYRDCSLFLQDFFRNFGVLLPRNSRAQSKIGLKIDLKNMSIEEKKQILSQKAVPFATLLYFPGHIMLYGGKIGNEHFAIHDSWGLKTKNNSRAIIGGIAITSLEIGSGRSDISKENLLISKITSANIIFPSQKEMISRAYGVKIDGNFVIFDDNSSQIFDDFVSKTNTNLFQNPSIKDMLALKYNNNGILSDAGRIRNEEFFSKIYGKNQDEIEKNLVDVLWLESSAKIKLKFNAKNGAAVALSNVSKELDLLTQNEPDMLKFLLNIAGTYKYRKIAATNRLSAHSWGIAIDLNTKYSHYWLWDKKSGRKKAKNKIPAKIVEIFEKNGFIWGGRWEHYDTMHFEYRPEFFIK